MKRCGIKKVFGKTIHKNMSASDMQLIWYSIPEDKRKEYKDIEKMIDIATMAEKVLEKAIPVYSATKKAIEAQKEIVLSSAAVAAGNLTYPIQKTAEEVAKKLFDSLVTKTIDDVTNMKDTLVAKFQEIAGCGDDVDENNDSSENPKVTKDNEI